MNLSSGAVIQALSLLLLAASATKVEAQFLPNSGFEAGDFALWTVTIPAGVSEFSGPQPAGSVEVAGSWGPRGALSTPIVPHEGNFLSALGSADFGFFTDPDAHYYITVCRSLSVHGGDTVSGWSLFYDGDNQPQETASVRLLDSGGQLVSTLWSDTSGAISSRGVLYQNASDWTYWQWQAPAEGDYTLQLGLATEGDDRLASFGLFDDIEVVPEPSPAWLVVGGFTGLVVLRRRPKK